MGGAAIRVPSRHASVSQYKNSNRDVRGTVCRRDRLLKFHYKSSSSGLSRTSRHCREFLPQDPFVFGACPCMPQSLSNTIRRCAYEPEHMIFVCAARTTIAPKISCSCSQGTVARSGQVNVKPWTNLPHDLTSCVRRRVAIPWRRVPASRPALFFTAFSVGPKISDSVLKHRPQKVPRFGLEAAFLSVEALFGLPGWRGSTR